MTVHFLRETAFARLFPITPMLISPVQGGSNIVMRKSADIKGSRRRRAWNLSTLSPLAGH